MNIMYLIICLIALIVVNILIFIAVILWEYCCYLRQADFNNRLYNHVVDIVWHVHDVKENLENCKR